MALESQGSIVRRESSVAGSTADLSTNTIGFDSTQNRITRQAGFADFSTGMRIQSNASLNNGVFTVSATGGTFLTVYETLAAQASGATITLNGHAMQTIGQVESFNGPGISAGVIGVTDLSATAKKKLIQLNDPGQLSLSVFWDNEASNANLHDALQRDMVARKVRKFDIKFTDNGSVSDQPGAVYFEGYITGFGINGAVDAAIKADLVIDISTGIEFINPV